MAVQALDWSVVIVGRWNRAILTPAGIAKRVFKADQKQIFVAVPLDGVSPYQVRHPDHKIIAMTDENRLHIQVLKMDYETLGHAMEAGVNALLALPETPVSAAGFNINFHSEDVSSDLAALLVADIDRDLAKLEYPVVARSITRSFEDGSGTLNITVSGKDPSFDIGCNFHRASADYKELVEWMQTPTEQAKKAVERVLALLHIDLEVPNNVEDGE
jgi:hypothetical protein